MTKGNNILPGGCTKEPEESAPPKEPEGCFGGTIREDDVLDRTISTDTEEEASDTEEEASDTDDTKNDHEEEFQERLRAIIIDQLDSTAELDSTDEEENSSNTFGSRK